jgi:hypothetical protein
VGTFVDGTFGIPAEAFDSRVDPAADAEDARRNIAPVADPLYRQEFVLRRDLSSAAELEAGRPASKQRVTRVTLRPGAERTFEQTLRALRTSSSLAYSVYELLSGGPQPSFMIVVQFPDWAALRQSTEPTRRILRAAGASILSAESETWTYRPDLSYLPD